MENENDLGRILANPFYAIEIHPSLAEQHPTLVSEEQWISANEKLIEEKGAKFFLEQLLENLKGNYIRNPE